MYSVHALEISIDGRGKTDLQPASTTICLTENSKPKSILQLIFMKKSS